MTRLTWYAFALDSNQQDIGKTVQWFDKYKNSYKGSTSTNWSSLLGQPRPDQTIQNTNQVFLSESACGLTLAGLGDTQTWFRQWQINLFQYNSPSSSQPLIFVLKELWNIRKVKAGVPCYLLCKVISDNDIPAQKKGNLECTFWLIYLEINYFFINYELYHLYVRNLSKVKCFILDIFVLIE